MSLRGVIGALNAATYTVQRRAVGSYDLHGRYTEGALTTLSIVADVQPLDGRTLLDDPDGRRGTDRRLLITTTQLYAQSPVAAEASAPPSGFEPDTVLIDGEAWTVTEVETWRSFGDVHYECIVTRTSKGA